MADRVEVSNLVLAKLGEAKKITDPNDDSKAARAIARVWNVTRDTALRAHLWNFALKRTSLAAGAALPDWGWAFAFPLPSDFIRLDIDKLEPWSVRGDHSLEGGNLLCDFAGPLNIRYVARIEEVGRWDAAFVETFANLLAWQVADDITGDLARKDRAWRAYEDSLPGARGIDGRENPPEPPEDSAWVTARYGR